MTGKSKRISNMYGNIRRKTYKILNGGGTSTSIQQLRTRIQQINHKNEDIKGSHLTGNAKTKHSHAVEKLHSLTTDQLQSISNKLYTQWIKDKNGKFKLYLKYNDDSGNSKYLTPEDIDDLLAFSGSVMANPFYSSPSPITGGGKYNNPKKNITRKNGSNKKAKYNGGGLSTKRPLPLPQTIGK